MKVVIFKKDFIYLFMREAETQAVRGEAGFLWGLDPGSPGSRPEPKADAQPLSHPGVPIAGCLPLCNTFLS